MQPFDPSKPLIGEDGLEYEDLGDFILGKPVECARNDVVKSLKSHPSVVQGLCQWSHAVWGQYCAQSRDGSFYIYGANNVYPQGLERFTPDSCRSEGDGEPRALEAPPDRLHEADQSAV